MPVNLLAFDTSSETCSVALLSGDACFLEKEDSPRKHAQLLMPMINSVLAQAKRHLTELDAIAFGCGPGSFTGLRIAAGVAQGLAFGSGLPAIPVSSLQALSLRRLLLDDAAFSLALIDARMGEVYWGVYQRPDGLEPCTDPDFSALNARLLARPSSQVLPVLIDQERVSAPDQVLDEMSHGRFLTYPMLSAGSLGLSGSGLVMAEQLPEGLGALSAEGAERIACHQAVTADAQDIALLARALYLQEGGLEHAKDVQPIYLRNEVAWKKLPGR